jgi:hypothetical protein
MNGEDQFEERLRRLPQRPVPPSWREEILLAARQASRSSQAPCLATSKRSEQGVTHFAPRWHAMLSTLLWPHPKAWAGLAAIWMLVLGLNFATRDEPTRVVRWTAPPSPQMRELLHQQEQLFAELIGPIAPPDADGPKPPAPQPHSQRGEQFLYT